MTTNTDRFRAHLAASRDAVWVVGRWLGSQGHEVVVPPTVMRPKSSDPKDYADEGDLYVVRHHGRVPVWRRVEVKHSSRSFSGRADWPYPSFIVCACHAWDKANPKPHVIYTVNREMTHVACVHGNTAGTWTTRTVTDDRYNDYSQQVYMVDLSLVQWESLEPHELKTA